MAKRTDTAVAELSEPEARESLRVKRWRSYRAALRAPITPENVEVVDDLARRLGRNVEADRRTLRWVAELEQTAKSAAKADELRASAAVRVAEMRQKAKEAQKAAEEAETQFRHAKSAVYASSAAQQAALDAQRDLDHIRGQEVDLLAE